MKAATITNSVIAVLELHEAFPSTSLPEDPAVLEAHIVASGFTPVLPAPAYNETTHTLDNQGPYLDGAYVYEYTVVARPALPKEQITAQILSDVQNRLDTFAQTRNYGGILSLATYATSAIPKFAAEGQYGVEARDATWATMYQIEQEVLAGARPAPQSYADIEADLPALTWPV